METLTTETKKQLGAFLMRLKNQESGFTQEEWQLGKVLEGYGLAKFTGPDQSPKMTSPLEHWSHMQLAAQSTYVLTGNGEAFVMTHTEKNLRSGNFLLPGEIPWYESWPWKLLWPAIVSVITALITTLIVQAIKGSEAK